MTATGGTSPTGRPATIRTPATRPRSAPGSGARSGRTRTPRRAGPRRHRARRPVRRARPRRPARSALVRRAVRRCRPAAPAGRPSAVPAAPDAAARRSGQARPRQADAPGGPLPPPPGGPHTPSPGGPHTPPPGMRQGPPPPRRDPAEDPTVMLRPQPDRSLPEPALLTHREPDDEAAFYESGYDDDYDDGPATPGDAKLARRKKIWRRIRRTAYVGTALGIITPIIAFFITYQLVEVKDPASVAAEQNKVVTFLYADEKTEMTKVAEDGGNRIMLKHDEIPEHVRKAVYAAEDTTFESNAGFDLSGIARAVWNQVQGKAGGGSTITQQYIKISSGDDDQTLQRKWVEIVKAYKMSETYDKDEIVTAYLNTIYFGRGAYGVAAAAKAFFNTDISKITKSQAALLAGMIQAPGRANNEEYQQKRWGYVTKRMIELGWLTEAEKGEFPTPVKGEDTKTSLSGPRKGLPALAFEELEGKGYTEQEIKAKGYTVVMTIDPRAQQIAEKSVAEVMKGQPKNLHPALVAIDPQSGAVRAYYGGERGWEFDFAAALQQPGSSFKPFDLVALLKKGEGLGKMYDSTPKAFGEDGKFVRNASRPRCGTQCTVAEAMKESLNVVFSDMVYNDVKPTGVADAAKQAGIRTPIKDRSINIAIGGGDTLVSTLDMASSYATFAANGTYRAPHLVSKVLDSNGEIVYDAANHPDNLDKQAFDQDRDTNAKIARNVTESLLPIPDYSGIECAEQRLCAGKTGTHQYVNAQGEETEHNSKAWMVGYTPQISAAVSLTGDKKERRLIDKDGTIIYGSGVPGQIWKLFMDRYLAGKDKLDFGPYEPIGEVEYETETQTTEEPVTTTDATTTTTTEPTTTEPTDTTDPTETETTTKTRPGRPTETGDLTTEPGFPLPGG
ncbi:transglycosylase domain-containing protein [Actinokineospora soli]|uniref:Transglycosylase domain-containing protein n=1 Tax=Actinokineospora soli TaxID=1048753 RepID=A0ABW2TYQ2_9PSEU